MRAMIWMAAGAAGVVALVACHPIRQQPAPAGPPECPHSWERKGVPSQAWPTVDVPEFNDCQRFILVDTVNGAEQRSYSRGYFAIFANPDSALVAQRAYPLDGSPVTSGVPVAFIYADQGAYGPLRIARGGNCLYLYRDQRRWRARIVSAVTGQMGDAVCRPSIDPRTMGEELSVRRTSVTGVDAADYPNVARWDWDRRAQQEYIGVRCDTAWCEVGNPIGFAPSEDRSGLVEPLMPESQRTVAVKGWYDEQYLARCRTGTCRPTALLGTVFPDPALDDAKGYGADWIRVARVRLVVDPGAPEAAHAADDLKEYKHKLNFDLASGPQLNEVFLCHDSASAQARCAVPSAVRAACPALASEETEHGAWWVRIVGAVTHDEQFRCVARRPVKPGVAHVVGAVRWRWLLDDETTWVRCIEGCCEAQGLH